MRDSVVDLYLDLIERCLTRTGFAPPFQLTGPPPGIRRLFYRMIRLALPKHFEIVRRASVEQQIQGQVWPVDAETMIGLPRLRNIRQCAQTIIRDGIPGDFLEAGVWRGGATIYMRAVLAAHCITDRRVWVCDSFKGLPPPDVKNYPADTTDWSKFEQLAIPLHQVRKNFERYGLLDDQVRFVEGFFSDTLRTSPIDQLAILRFDGDMYKSTMDVLEPLYGKVSAGGFVIIDDYGSVPACKQAVEFFRNNRNISDPIQVIDSGGVFWRKSS